MSTKGVAMKDCHLSFTELQKHHICIHDFVIEPCPRLECGKGVAGDGDVFDSRNDGRGVAHSCCCVLDQFPLRAGDSAV